MKQLWAPWRMEFLTSEGKPTGCVFCSLPKAGNDRQSLILHRAKSCYLILNKYPYNNGHLMVVPYLHTADFAKLDSVTVVEMMKLTQETVEKLEQAYHPQGFNVGMNLGVAGGAGIAEHLHLHVVPRWNGDTNFLPVLADTKSMPEHLFACYDKLLPLFS